MFLIAGIIAAAAVGARRKKSYHLPVVLPCLVPMKLAIVSLEERLK